MMRPNDGRGFAFVPREVVAQPKAFGAAPGLLDPADDVEVTGERYRAAMLQHVMAFSARAALLKTNGITPSAFARRFPERGLGADRVRRIFRGETMAQLTDVMFWMEHFPEVADAISEQTSAWFRAVSNVPEVAVVSDALESPPEPTVQETLAASRMQTPAQQPGVGASAMRRSPENPFVSAPRGIRYPPR